MIFLFCITTIIIVALAAECIKWKSEADKWRKLNDEELNNWN